jgi:hypothetical protein
VAVHRDLGWWYWLTTGVFLLGVVAGCQASILAVIALILAQALHYRRREGAFSAFPVQVRIGYLLWFIAGLWDPLAPMLWIQLAGTTAMVTVDYCPMARLTALMPWNRSRPLSLRLVWRTFVSPPVRGSVLEVSRAVR